VLTATLYVVMEKSTGKLEHLDPFSCSEIGIFLMLPSSGFNELDPIVLDHNNLDKCSNSLLIHADNHLTNIQLK
jgi:hypothetical protein